MADPVLEALAELLCDALLLDPDVLACADELDGLLAAPHALNAITAPVAKRAIPAVRSETVARWARRAVLLLAGCEVRGPLSEFFMP